MNKQEFIDRLRIALSGTVSAEQVQEHVNYYEDYINTQIRMGHREEDVLEALGNPRLIAKTILETSGQGGAYEDVNQQGGEYRSMEQRNTTFLNQRKVIQLPGWLWAIIVVLIVILLLGVVFTVLSAFAPIIVIMLIVFSMVKFFERLN